MDHSRYNSLISRLHPDNGRINEKKGKKVRGKVGDNSHQMAIIAGQQEAFPLFEFTASFCPKADRRVEGAAPKDRLCEKKTGGNKGSTGLPVRAADSGRYCSVPTATAYTGCSFYFDRIHFDANIFILRRMYIFASSLFGGSGQHRGPVYLFVNSGPEPTGSPAAERERVRGGDKGKRGRENVYRAHAFFFISFYERSMPPKIGAGEGGTRSCEVCIFLFLLLFLFYHFKRERAKRLNRKIQKNARRFTDKSLSFERRIGYFENRIASHSSVVLRSQSMREQMIQERKAPAPSSVRDSVYMNAFRNRSLFESVP
ncbi:hypothetical protein V1477_008813 [Vespula maculifrons]|uniref:Uncharacterized protein n=1 Tax=Vespula maculifrons TaxID=7453 RepID=A0ABD2CF20_VESMC